MKKNIAFLILMISTTIAQAELVIQKISDQIYALVGETTQRSPTNFGNNSTHGVIITNEGVVLVDSGASYLGAQEIHRAIQTLTDQPIKIVINSGGQDHRWLGNDYFLKLGARIIASDKTRQDQQARVDYHLDRLGGLIKQSLDGTVPVFAKQTFDESLKLNLGGVNLELYHFGPAHTVGDIVLWLPSEQVMFTGDVVFNDRMLGVGPARNIRSWIEVFDKMATFKPKYIVPGHGKVSDLPTATKNTQAYLKFLEAEIAKVLDNDGDMIDASRIDQSKFHFLSSHESIAARNAQWVYEQLEFD